MICAREISLFILTGLLVGLRASEFTFNFDHEQHLPTFERFRHPLPPHQAAWTEAREYIKRSFLEYSLSLDAQTFETEIANNDNELLEVKGENVIGESLSPDPNAPVLLMGAYYDSPLHSAPLRQSGASMASLLETARTFQKMKLGKTFNQKVSVVFVAFDLNAQRYVPSGPGTPGAAFFVKEWLSKTVKGRKFIGAILLDSVASVNTEKNSQSLMQGFDRAFPDAYESIVESEFKGDFLAALSRSDKTNLNLTLHYSDKYESVASDAPFHMEKLILADGVKISPALKGFLRSSSVLRFWTHVPPFPGLLLTDLGETRTDFDEDECSLDCTRETFWSDTRKEFVEATTLASLRMVLSYQEMITESPGTTTESGPGEPDDTDNKSSTLLLSWYLAVFSCVVLFYSLGL